MSLDFDTIAYRNIGRDYEKWMTIGLLEKRKNTIISFDEVYRKNGFTLVEDMIR